MAKLSSIIKNKKRADTVKRYSEKRLALKKICKDQSKSFEERMEARQKLSSLPRNANPNRVRNRCHITGRARGFYRKFGLGRSVLREVAMKGEIPGLTLSSW